MAPSGLLRHGRPLKRWRYVGIFSEELMACAALIQVGPARQSFWALTLANEQRVRERTRRLPRRGEVQLLRGLPSAGAAPAARTRAGAGPGSLRVHDRGVLLELELDEEAGIECLCPHGRASVWTRKQAGVAARGTISIDGSPPRPLHARAVIDDTAGHHARETEWWWSAGVGERRDGTPVAWNLVSGINDPAHGSERAVWIDGAAHEVAPVSFAPDLSALSGADGSRLRFCAQAERSRHENLLIASSDYRAPFGTFAGALPGGVELRSGRGVMEHHRARW